MKYQALFSLKKYTQKIKMSSAAVVINILKIQGNKFLKLSPHFQSTLNTYMLWANSEDDKLMIFLLFSLKNNI